jgi:hypothetical protein
MAIPTFEEVDRHVQAVDLGALKAASKHQASAPGAAGVGGNICAAYKTVRPILELVANTILIPPKWRAIVQAFIDVMDKLCP